MPTLCALVAAVLNLASAWWQPALPGYRYRFPADYGAHVRARSEWWYYTGNVFADRARRYGFELTFFRFGMQRPLPGGSAWDIDDLYFAHFAVSDIGRNRFYYFDRTGRAALGFAGAAVGDENAWVGSWRAQRRLDGAALLSAAAPAAALRLTLRPRKPAVIHGQNGRSRKGACATCASHYYSFTRLEAKGTLTIDGSSVRVKGLAWNDHEWGSDELQPGVVGWDWFSIQLSNRTEIMLYSLRLGDGTSVPQSSGTLINADGSSRYLALSDFSIRALGVWSSPHSGARYPAGWMVRLPKERIDLRVVPAMADQELLTGRSTGADYWEGACTIAGTYGARAVRGVGYTELTGYSKTSKLPI
ncbi:MAG: carotenoid 1,2-hydratase [Candidatus Eremiobacteraeota bacterium]|nr:carotenoid 1,2-hydratase [Candidatus Eremiobacteraeota bacterium]